MIGTDQNFDLLKTETHTQTSNLLNTFFMHACVPTITKPTRVTHTSATLIDNIYVKINNTYHIESGVVMTDISDHFPIFSFITYRHAKPYNSKPLTFGQ